MTHRMITTTVLLIAVVGGAQADDVKPADAAKDPAKAAAATKEPAAKAAAAQATAGGQVAVLETAQGTIVIKFHEKDAPKTVANFRKLVQSKFYDGTYWQNPYGKKFGIRGIPAMFLLDKNGMVVSTNARGKKLEQEVKRLLGL